MDPRLGLTVDLGTQAYPAGLTIDWGRYHQDLFAQMFDRVAGAGAYSDYQVWEYSGPKFSDPTRVITQAQRDSLAALGQFRLLEYDQLNQEGVVKDYHQPYVDEFVIGVHGDPTPELHFEASYAQRQYRNIIALVDKNEAYLGEQVTLSLWYDGGNGMRQAKTTTYDGPKDSYTVTANCYAGRWRLAYSVSATVAGASASKRDESPAQTITTKDCAG